MAKAGAAADGVEGNLGPELKKLLALLGPDLIRQHFLSGAITMRWR